MDTSKRFREDYITGTIFFFTPDVMVRNHNTAEFLILMVWINFLQQYGSDSSSASVYKCILMPLIHNTLHSNALVLILSFP